MIKLDIGNKNTSLSSDEATDIIKNLEKLEDNLIRVLEIATETTNILKQPESALSCDYDALQTLSTEYSTSVSNLHKQLLEYGKVLVKPVSSAETNAVSISLEIEQLNQTIEELAQKQSFTDSK